jgi:cell division protein FtsB
MNNLENKEKKQEKTIVEELSNILDSISTTIITDCIIQNKEDIEQLKKDVKALRKENAKLRQIVNELRKG